MDNEWGITAEEDVTAQGFAQFGDEDTAGFAVRPIDIRQYSKDDILGMAVGTKCMFLATSKRQVLRKRTDRENEQFAVLSLPYKGIMSKASLYTDLSGYHCIIVVSPKTMFYVNYESSTVFALEKLPGIEITSMAFSPDAQMSNSGTILVGSGDGSIYTYRVETGSESLSDKIFEEDLTCVFQVSGNASVYGIIYDTYTVKDAKGANLLNTLVLAATNDTCYQFVGPTSFPKLFETYKQFPEELNKNKESHPRDTMERSELKPYYRYSPDTGLELSAFVWKSGVGACYGKLRPKDDFHKPIIVSKFELDSYQKQVNGPNIPTETPLPQCVGINDSSVFLLYQDNVTVMSISSKQIEYSEDFRAVDKMLGMAYEPVTKSMWMHSYKNLYRMTAGADKAPWRTEMQTGNFDNSLELCRESDSLRKYAEYVAGVFADSEFEARRFSKAAELYANSNRGFEEIVTKYMLAADENEGLEIYLEKRLEKYDAKKEKLIQRVLLCTLIIQLKLAKLSRLKSAAAEPIGENASEQEQKEKKRKGTQCKKLEAEFREFLKSHEESIEADTVFQLLQNHSRPDDCLWFAEQKENYDAIVQYYIDNKDYKKALEILGGMSDEGKKNKLMLNYASLFIQNITRTAIEDLMSNFPTIQVDELIPALMSVGNQDRMYANTLIRQSAAKKNSKLLYNLFVFFLAQSCDEASVDELTQFMETQEAKLRRGEPLDIDPDFALNVFKFFEKTVPLTRAYSMLELHEDAVKIALEKGELKLAKEYANTPKDEKLRKKLWLSVATAVMRPKKENAGMLQQTSFALVTESQGNLVLNDVLPLVSPKIKLVTFRDDILSQVRLYDAKIEEFKGTISDCNNSAREIADQYKLFHTVRFVMPPDKCCDCCEKVLINARKFCTFPCLHGFHLGCMMEWYENYQICMSSDARTEKLQRLEVLTKKLQGILGSHGYLIGDNGLIDSVQQVLSGKATAIKRKEEKEMMGELEGEELAYLGSCKKQLEELLAEECLVCGDIAIEKVDVPFDSAVEVAWTL